ncbi:quinol monooxygenase YgiN [Paenarthrobacter nitroguajacolicus]|uniref:putative quinol monooxygenase n=1 Tax=Paenarthrobacter nitroguajacolicus TaxID=211146 RepID=UPI00285A9D34|nr:putative quinol monooxygenase [Paenarthrobacter nitroguajacolicus]MDR6986952.1 quinol monooxygenase YgiN [Paenarthrobacter nitroguajacolicus]
MTHRPTDRNGTDRQGTGEVWLMPVFVAEAGHEKDLQEALRSLQTQSRKDAGCLEYTVFSDAQRPGTFVLFEGWSRDEDLAAHNEESHVKDFMKEVSPLLAVPFSVTPLAPLQ